MQTITDFGDFLSTLVETQLGRGESPLVQVENDSFVFPKRNKRVLKNQKFTFQVHENESATYTAEQIVHCYRTRDLDTKLFYGEKTDFRKVSLAHRKYLIDMMKSGSKLIPQVTTAAQTSTSKPSIQDDRKRERQLQGEDRKREVKSSRTLTSQPTKLSDVLKLEVKYHDRNSALNALRSFQEVIDLGFGSKANKDDKSQNGSIRQKRSKMLGHPIIVVPPNSSALLNLFNVKQFLEDMNYVSYEEIKRKNPNETKPEYVYVTHKKHPILGDVRFKVVDSVLSFDDATWDRVVAVVVSGQAWQLKGWKWSTPAEIFAHVKGLYLYFDDAKLSDQIKGWNVVALPIKPQSRNKDILQAHEVWKQIDNHLERSKPQLLQSLIEDAERRSRSEREARQKALEDEEEEEDLVNADA